MKHFLIFMILLISCNNSNQRSVYDYSEFDNYKKQLPNIALPLVYSTNSGIVTDIPNINIMDLSKYSKFWNEKTIGKLYESDEYVIIVEREIGDYGPVPIFITYDKNGKKINSFNAYKTSGDDMGYKSFEFVTVDKSNMVTVIDSTTTWKLNSDETNIIDGSDSLSIGKTIYKLDKDGIYTKQ
jgi:hypothetical protein